MFSAHSPLAAQGQRTERRVMEFGWMREGDAREWNRIPARLGRKWHLDGMMEREKVATGQGPGQHPTH